MQDAERFLLTYLYFANAWAVLRRLLLWMAYGYALAMGICHGTWFAARLEGRDCRVGWWPPALLCQK